MAVGRNLIVNRTPFGKSGTDISSFVYVEDHITSLHGPEAAIFFNKMYRSDAQVKKLIAAIVGPIKSGKWEIESASDDKVDLEHAALMQQILFKDISWSKFMGEVTTFPRLGHAIFEVINENREHPDFGMYSGLAQLAFRHQTTIEEWHHDGKTGCLERIRQRQTGDVDFDVFIPADVLLIFYNEQEGDNNGLSLLRPMFGAYRRKLLALELQIIGIERFAIPTPIVGVPQKIKTSDKEYIEAKRAIERFTSSEDAHIMKPEGWTLELFANNYDPQKVQTFIKAQDEAMAGSVVATFLELGTGGNAGAFALARDLSDFFLDGIEYFAHIIEDTINTRLIPHLMRLNFGDRVPVLPMLKHSNISDKAGKELMEIITGYTASGVIQTDEALEDHVRKVHNLPKKAEGTQIENQESKTDPDPNATETENVDNVDELTDIRTDRSGPIDTTGNVNLKIKLAINTVTDDRNHVHLDSVGNDTSGAFTDTEREPEMHAHDILDEAGEIVSRTSFDAFGEGHTHQDLTGTTGPPEEIDLGGHPVRRRRRKTKKEEEEMRRRQRKLSIKNPRTAKELIINGQNRVTVLMRENLNFIKDKYIADIMRNYRQLPDKQKLNAINKVTPGGTAKFRRSLSALYTQIANESLEMARGEVPSKSTVKLKDKPALIKYLNPKGEIKLQENRKLPTRIQILVARQAEKVQEKYTNDLADRAAFQFVTTESSTNDPALIEQDLNRASDELIEGGNIDRAAANSSALIVNDARNEFFFDEEVLEDIQSFTFINFDPKSAICRKLSANGTGRTFATNDAEFLRFSPPLHHNCKSYLRANLATTTNVPEIQPLPGISQAERDSITLSSKEGFK